MKVLVVSNMGPKLSTPLQGGFVDKQVSRLKDSGLVISYFWLKWNGDSLIYKLFKYPVFFGRFFFKYILSSKHYDIVHIHFYFPTILCALMYKIFRNNKVKVVVTCHGSDVYSYMPANWLYKKLTSIVDHWFFTSQSLYQKFHLKLNNKTILCAGYDDHIFTCTNFEKERSIDCVFVGALDHNKGIDRLIWLVNHMPTVKFSVIGSGPLLDELEQCAKTNNNLSILGNKAPKEVACILKKSKVLLSLSRKESFGLVMAEAHACNTLCIVTKTDGSEEQLNNWPFMVSQQNFESDILDKLKENIIYCLNLDIVSYENFQAKAVESNLAFSLSNVTNVISIKYAQLYKEHKAEV